MQDVALKSPQANEIQEPSKLDTDDLFSVLCEWFETDRDHSSKWRTRAREDFAFAALDQWPEEDKKRLEAQGRPAITFDRTGPIIASVCGLEINSRHDTIFIPRTSAPMVVEANEILSAASQWMADSCDANDEQSEAFEDACIAGMGWTEQRIDYEEDSDGMYIEEKTDCLEMYWDAMARKKNLVDARRVWHVKEYTLAEARNMAREKKWTDESGRPVSDTDLNASWAAPELEDRDPPKSWEAKRVRDGDGDNMGELDEKSKVHLVHVQWIEKEPYFKTAVPQQDGTMKLVNLGQVQHAAAQGQMSQNGMPRLKSVQLVRKVYKQAYIGARILGQVGPTLSRCGFTYKCITGRRNRNKGTWFGLITVMRDPQMWANKWLSQSLHILNSTAKGGIMAESGAFKDIREAQETWAQPDAITEVEDGAITGNKIAPKPGQGLPAGHQNLMEFAISSIRDATGINIEMLGMSEQNQPGVLDRQRKQAAMTILAPMFDSLRRFRKEVGRNRLCFIQDFLSDGRLIRIADTDPKGSKVMRTVQLLRDKTSGEYEVVVDDAPTSPNQKEQTFAILQALQPYLAPFSSNPQIALTILEYSPLPSEVVEAFRRVASQGPTPQEQVKDSMQMQMGAANIRKTNAQADKDEALAQTHHTSTTLEILRDTGALRTKVPTAGEYRGNGR